MTFDEWLATRSERKTFTDEDAGAYEGHQGYTYDAGFVCVSGEGFMVPLPQTEREFATLAEAEAYLWAEWCGPEINGGEA